MQFTFGSPDKQLISQVQEELNELLSLEDLSLDKAYWTPVYTMSTVNVVLDQFPPEAPVGWRFMMAKRNLGAVAGDFAYGKNAGGGKNGKAAVAVTTGVYDGPAVDQAFAALLHDWGLTNPEGYEARLLRISSPSVQALWLVPKGKTDKAKIIPYRTLAEAIERKPYEVTDFFALLKPLAEKKLHLRDL